MTFFNHLLTQMYSVDANVVFLCGDLNARISNKPDCLDIDMVSPRIALDATLNSHGESLLEFLLDCKCCVVNGRINPTVDNYTSISVKGKAVVDYIITPHECLPSCINFKVITPSELLDNNPHCTCLIGERCRLPDHSLLLLEFQISCIDPVLSDNSLSEAYTPTKRRPRVHQETFLSSNACQAALTGLICHLECGDKTQSHIDGWYNSFCNLLYGEFTHSPNTGVRADVRQRGSKRQPKPYWSAELQLLWKSKTQAEREFLKCREPANRVLLRDLYKRFQVSFDKSLRKHKRKFSRGQALRLDHLQSNNPQQFWREINKLGQRQKTSVCADKKTPFACKQQGKTHK